MNAAHLQASLDFVRTERDKLEETILGAVTKAVNAFQEATGVSVRGIEVEMVEVGTHSTPQTYPSKVEATINLNALV
jgi:hypothetical protein